jgi:hypothetical protein
MAEVQATARSLGFVEVTTPKIRRAEDIAAVFESLKGHAEEFTSRPTRSYSPIGFKSAIWR